jgi:NADH-quinone oxidoreductase subunit J
MEPVNAIPESAVAETIIFAILAGATVVGALFTITRRNPVVAVMGLVGTFFALAGIYATLAAHFVAVLQILVYAGAIMVLFIFVVMILNRDEVSPISFRGILTRAVGVVASGYLVLVFVRVVWNTRATPLMRGPLAAPSADFGTVASVGHALFTDFVLPFEAISLLLLVAVVGGLVVSRSHKQEEMAEASARRRAEILATSSEEGPAVAHTGGHGHGHH